MNKDNIDQKIEQSIEQSAQKITPQPFYRVLEKIAKDKSTETYEDVFEKQTSKKNNVVMKSVVIAASLLILLAIGSVASVMSMNSFYSMDAEADSLYLAQTEGVDSGSSSQEDTVSDTVSDSDESNCVSGENCSNIE